MGIVVRCRAGHKSSSRETMRELAHRFAEFGTLGPCPEGRGRCKEVRDFSVVHTTAGEGKRDYEVVSVRPTRPLEDADRIGRDVIIFLLRDRNSGAHSLWTYYWVKNRHGKWANGQFPPLFSQRDAEILRTCVDDVQRLNRESNEAT